MAVRSQRVWRNSPATLVIVIVLVVLAGVAISSLASLIWIREQEPLLVDAPVGLVAFTVDTVRHLSVVGEQTRRGDGSALLEYACREMLGQVNHAAPRRPVLR